MGLPLAINPIGMIHFVAPGFNPLTNATNPVKTIYVVASPASASLMCARWCCTCQADMAMACA